jgi:hypothetical protein
MSGWNANFGLIWSPREDFNVGAAARTPFTADLDLRRRRTDYFVFGSVDPTTVTENAAARDDLELDFPGAIGFGVSWRPRSTLTVSADYTRTFWSNGQIRNYFVLERTPLGQDPPPPIVYPALPYPTLDDPIQRDTTQVRAGAEHVFLLERVKIPVRAGAFTDKQYFRGGDGQAPTYWGLSVGAGVIAGPFLFDLAYVHEWGSYADTPPSTDRVSVRFGRFYLSMIFRFGGR